MAKKMVDEMAQANLQIKDEIKDFRILKDYIEYLKDYDYPAHKGKFPPYAQNVIQRLIRSHISLFCEKIGYSFVAFDVFHHEISSDDGNEYHFNVKFLDDDDYEEVKDFLDDFIEYTGITVEVKQIGNNPYKKWAWEKIWAPDEVHRRI